MKFMISSEGPCFQYPQILFLKKRAAKFLFWQRMWNKLGNSDYFLSVTGNIEVFLTNFVSIWIASFSEAGFLDCVKGSNPDLETDEKDIQNCKIMLKYPENLKSKRTWVTLVNDGKSLHLSIMGDKAKFGYPLHLKMYLQKGSKELKITHPLMTSIKDLRASERELTMLLQKKDKEIEEYKCEGGEIALRHLKTVPFDSESHTKTHRAYNELFGSQEIPESLLAKLVVKSELDSEPKILPTEKIQNISSPNNIKQEIKAESSTSSQSSTTAVNDRPIKRQRRTLNI